MNRLRSLLIVAAIGAGAVLTACGSSITENSSTPTYFPSSPLPTPNLTQTSGGPATPSPAGPSGAGQAGTNGLGTPASQVAATAQLSFNPTTVTVKVGDVIQWTDTSNVPHNVTFDQNPELSSGTLQQGDTWQVQFSKPGTYSYHCTFHPGMNGTITVSG